MKLINLLFIILGLFFTALGMIGVILPILPTTPFLILASMCFMRGSEKFDRWLRATGIYKNYAEDFVRDRSMTLKRKAKLMLLSDTMLLFPLIKLDNYFKLFIIIVILFKYWYFIFMIKTKKE